MPVKRKKLSVPINVRSQKMVRLCYMLRLPIECEEKRIEMYQSEIDNLKRMFPERSSEFVESLILFCDWFIV